VTSAILTGSLLTKATGHHDRFYYAGSPGAGSADVEARSGPKFALEPEQRADCDENTLRLVRAPGESYSDVITARERRQALEKPAGGSRASSAVPFRAECLRPTTSLQRRVSDGETDPEDFIRPSYNATGGASKCVDEDFHEWTPTRHSH
jgi:hypothetical protein